MDIEEDEDTDMDIDADEEDEDDEMDVEIEEEAEKEHSAPAYPVVVALPATAPSAEETESFETDESAATPPPHPAYRMTARITIPEPVPVPAWSDSEVARLLAISSPTRPDAPPPMPTSAPTSLPPLLLPSASRREDRPEVNLPPRKRLGIALSPRYEVGESSAAAAARPAGGLRADYGFVSTMDREIRRDPERYVGYGIMDLWDEITTSKLMETEARMSREAWGRSRDASDLARAEVMSLRTTVHAQMSDCGRSEEMRELRAADHTRQQQII
ncbi:hypothetical protein Tco_0043084 [Tanacetum coccineum]